MEIAICLLIPYLLAGLYLASVLAYEGCKAGLKLRDGWPWIALMLVGWLPLILWRAVTRDDSTE